jgi:hypothetical protein
MSNLKYTDDLELLQIIKQGYTRRQQLAAERKILRAKIDNLLDQIEQIDQRIANTAMRCRWAMHYLQGGIPADEDPQNIFISNSKDAFPSEE